MPTRAEVRGKKKKEEEFGPPEPEVENVRNIKGLSPAAGAIREDYTTRGGFRQKGTTTFSGSRPIGQGLGQARQAGPAAIDEFERAKSLSSNLPAGEIGDRFKREARLAEAKLLSEIGKEKLGAQVAREKIAGDLTSARLTAASSARDADLKRSERLTGLAKDVRESDEAGFDLLRSEVGEGKGLTSPAKGFLSKFLSKEIDDETGGFDFLAGGGLSSNLTPTEVQNSVITTETQLGRPVFKFTTPEGKTTYIHQNQFFGSENEDSASSILNRLMKQFGTQDDKGNFSLKLSDVSQ